MADRSEATFDKLTGRGGLFGRTFNNNYATMERKCNRKRTTVKAKRRYDLW